MRSCFPEDLQALALRRRLLAHAVERGGRLGRGLGELASLEEPNLEHAMLLRALLSRFDGRDRLTCHHLLHQRAEQVESFEQSTTFRTDGTSQLRNHRSAIHKSTATGKP